MNAKNISPTSSKIKYIDPHCHLWDLSLGYNTWISDKESPLLGSLKPLNQNYLANDYLKDTADFKIEKCIHIEAASTRFSKQETEWIVKLAQQHPLIGGVVGGVDLLSNNVDELLSFYATCPLLKGVRQILNWHVNNKYTAADRCDDLDNPAWQKPYALLKKYNLSFDMQICPTQMQSAYALIKKYPDVNVILNHAGMPIEEDISHWEKGLIQLARCPNVAIKLSGFGMLNHEYTTQSIQPYVDFILNTFGMDRCMFASNFPVDKLYRNFSSMIKSYQDTVAHASISEKEKLFYSNAKRIYKID